MLISSFSENCYSHSVNILDAPLPTASNEILEAKIVDELVSKHYVVMDLGDF